MYNSKAFIHQKNFRIHLFSTMDFARKPTSRDALPCVSTGGEGRRGLFSQLFTELKPVQDW